MTQFFIRPTEAPRICSVGVWKQLEPFWGLRIGFLGVPGTAAAALFFRVTVKRLVFVSRKITQFLIDVLGVTSREVAIQELRKA